MKKVVRGTVLGTLLFGAMLLCSIVVLCIFQVAFQIHIDNVFLEGFEVAFAALGILVAGWVLTRLRT